MKRKTLYLVSIVILCAMPVEAEQIELTGVVRDFKRGDWVDGHPDFQTAGAMSRFGLVHGMVTMELDEDGKPVYNPVRPSKDTIDSEASFRQWYRDTPDVNVSAPLTVTLNKGLGEQSGGVYTFEEWRFWPIDGQLVGNQGLSHNYHFTFELHTEFAYEPGQNFRFIGDDDVWVYVNGTRVIDLGGVHPINIGEVVFFDGKAFVEKSHFPIGGVVQKVTSSMANQLAQKWNKLNLPGSCPIAYEDHYIDLGLLPNDAAEARVEFNDTSVNIYATKDLSDVVIGFNDGSQQNFENLSVGASATFSGTGSYQGKTIKDCWINAGSGGSGTEQHFTAAGPVRDSSTLDFFFAERHTTQSRFRIDTSMELVSRSANTISALYD